ncbi:MAG: hypothetical protein H6718_11085 [Polyangiaceae bacterium]|nr:hypothetical protein [Myxococcales bacterium]MCB9585933.1 hypothetical protein [Polyangiaceae bacterium]MCB9607137.1 hypothetical protein [Polyangiaceae bacterium]
MRSSVVLLLCLGVSLLGCKQLQSSKEGEAKGPANSENAGEQSLDTPNLAACSTLSWDRFKLIGDAKLQGATLSLLQQQSQVSAAWLPTELSVEDLQLSLVLEQGGDVKRYADGIAFTFLEGEVPSEPGAGGPSLGVPTLPIVAAGIHFPMEEPHLFLELWQGKEGVPYMDEPSSRAKVQRSAGAKLVRLRVHQGDVALALHASTDPASTATVTRAKLGLNGARKLGITGATGVYSAQIAVRDIKLFSGKCQ